MSASIGSKRKRKQKEEFSTTASSDDSDADIEDNQNTKTYPRVNPNIIPVDKLVKRYKTKQAAKKETTGETSDQLVASGSFNASNYTTLNSEQIAECTRVYHTFPLLRTVINIVVNNVLGGGVLIEVKGRKNSDGRTRFHNTVWKDWIAAVLVDLFVYGFSISVVKPWPKYVGAPARVAIDEIQVRFRPDIFGQREYIALDIRAIQGLQTTGISSRRTPAPALLSGGQPIPDIHVFEMNPPDSKGNLRSIVFSLIPDILHYQSMMDMNRQITYRMTQTEVILEKKETKFDINNLGLSFPTEVNPTNPDNRAIYTSRLEYEQDALAVANARRMDAGLGPITTANTLNAERIGMVDFIHLPENTSVSTQVARTTYDKMEEERVRLETLVGAALGVPRSIFVETSQAKAGSSENNREVFRNSQNHIKHMIQPIIHTMFLHINRHLFTYGVIGHNNTAFIDDQDNDDEQDDNERTEAMVRVSLPGTPPPEVLDQLYTMGILDYDAYCRMLSSIWGMPMEVFNEEPELEVKELNGITESDGPKTEVTKTSKSGDASNSTTIKTTGDPNGPNGKRPPKKKQKLGNSSAPFNSKY